MLRNRILPKFSSLSVRYGLLSARCPADDGESRTEDERMVLESKAAGSHIDYGSIASKRQSREAESECGEGADSGAGTGPGTGEGTGAGTGTAGTDGTTTGTPLVSIHDTASTPNGQQQQQPGDAHSKPDQSMTQSHGMNDLYQRQPLLSNAKTTDRGSSWSDKNGTSINAQPVYSDEDEHQSSSFNPNGAIRIDIPQPACEKNRFPKEIWKTFIALLLLLLNFILTTVVLALVHDKVPDRKIYKPLPDVFLESVPAQDWALDVSEILIMVSTTIASLVVLFHKHRFIVMRRLFLLLALLYFMRSVTMYVTVMPVASTTYTCSPKSNETDTILIAKRVIQLFSGFGLSINGKHTYCGDYIYSGHTTILVISYLTVAEYSPKKFIVLHWTSFCMSLIGIIMVLVAHGHYTVDVIIAYFVTTWLFWTYHTLANHSFLKQSSSRNHLSKVWWFRLFLFFECNIGAPVPRQYDWPLPWPRRCLSKHPNRDS
nr:PREDICTED: phosphatidylcholine:ceramide cholinephosphotransferase 2-like isoform X2 [Bemisia tabaci]